MDDPIKESEARGGRALPELVSWEGFGDCEGGENEESSKR